MTHGDDDGLVVPPKLAPTQVVVVPILRDDEARSAVLAKADEVKARLTEAGVRVKIDSRDHLSPGAKYFEWERKGVPLRIEIGPKDLEKGSLALARRVRGEDEPRKEFVDEGEAIASVPRRLDAFQKQLFDAAVARREANSYRGVTSMDELREIMEGEGGFVYTGWSGDPAVEDRIKEETKATARCIPVEEFRSETPPEQCIGGDAPATCEVIWAKAY